VKRFLAFVLIAALAGFTTGCGNQQGMTEDKPKTTTETKDGKTTGETKTMTDTKTKTTAPATGGTTNEKTPRRAPIRPSSIC
jgi:hypothetical protein